MKLRASILVAILLAALPAAASAHEIKGPVTVDCSSHSATAHGIKFGGEGLPMTATVTGPAGYVVTFQITTDEWTATFAIAGNGSYELDWPNSGDFGPVPFQVECAEATPTPTPSASATPRDPSPTPRIPDKTPPPTDTAQRVVQNRGPVLLVVFGLLMAATGIGMLRRLARP